MCVCVCFLDLCMLCIFVERFFKSLSCWLDLCLSSLLVAFIIMCFPFLKTSFLQAQQLLGRFTIVSFLSGFLSLASIETLMDWDCDKISQDKKKEGLDRRKSDNLSRIYREIVELEENEFFKGGKTNRYECNKWVTQPKIQSTC